MKLTGKIASATVALSIIGTAAFAEAKPEHRPMKELTRAEAIEHAGERFDKADTNGDGVLSRDEMKAGAKSMRGRKPGPRGDAHDHGKRGEKGRDFFAKIDANGDDSLSFEEFETLHDKLSERHGSEAKHDAKSAFAKLDSNSDGQVSKDELKRAKKHGDKRPDRKGE